MDLKSIKKHEIPEFLEYLMKFSKGTTKGIWEQKIVNTTLPCIAISSKKIDEIVREISKGDFLKFIDLWIWENHSCTIILGKLISKIKDFEIQKKYLEIFASKSDNWATIDCLKFNFNERNKNKFIAFSKQLLKNQHPFTRRLGVLILLKLCKDVGSIDKILSIIPTLYKEKEYYVNMAISWLVCECFIHHKEKTLLLFKNNHLNKFVNNKAISKCIDSFRVSNQDKQILRSLKI